MTVGIEMGLSMGPGAEPARLDLEELLATLPGLADHAIWKRKGALVDDEVVLYAVADPLPVDDLRLRIAELPSFMRPAAVARVAALPRDAAFFIASIMPTNVRELEGALNRLKATVEFTGEEVSVSFIKHTLSDVIVTHRHLISIEDVQKAVAHFYNVRVRDLCSPQRTRTIVRPRQMAMALAKEVTTSSYPEIGEAFGGRDHTTVIHACRKMDELRANQPQIDADYRHIMASLQNGWSGG